MKLLIALISLVTLLHASDSEDVNGENGYDSDYEYVEEDEDDAETSVSDIKAAASVETSAPMTVKTSLPVVKESLEGGSRTEPKVKFFVSIPNGPTLPVTMRESQLFEDLTTVVWESMLDAGIEIKPFEIIRPGAGQALLPGLPIRALNLEGYRLRLRYKA